MDIKIRAFHKKDKYMDYNRCNGWVISSLSYITDVWEIMLWTTQIDKNGKNIYQGDILKYGDAQVEIYWAGWKWEYRILKGSLTQPLFILDIFSGSEVIGNIYENLNHLG